MGFIPAANVRHPYGAGELKQVYQKNLSLGFTLAASIQFVLVAVLWIFVDAPMEERPPRVARIFTYEEVKLPKALSTKTFGLSSNPVLAAPSLPFSPSPKKKNLISKPSKSFVAPVHAGIGLPEFGPGAGLEKIESSERAMASEIPGNPKVKDDRMGLPGGGNGSGDQRARGGSPRASVSGVTPDGFDLSGVGSSRRLGSAGGGIGDGGGDEDDGGIGYSMSWSQGRPRRKISGSLPVYPSGVNVESSIVLFATVVPDGGVKNLQPARKGERRLEEAAMKEVRFWRFESLAPAVQQVDQTCLITFQFKLK